MPEDGRKKSSTPTSNEYRFPDNSQDFQNNSLQVNNSNVLSSGALMTGSKAQNAGMLGATQGQRLKLSSHENLRTSGIHALDQAASNGNQAENAETGSNPIKNSISRKSSKNQVYNDYTKEQVDSIV